MGTDTNAITVVGVRIPNRKFVTTEEKVSSCKCKCDKTDCKFCPKCGKRLGEKYTVGKYIPDVLEEYGEISQFGDYEVYHESYGERKSEYSYICIYKGEKRGPRSYDAGQEVVCPFSFEELIEKREQLRKFLTERGLADDFDKNFGIHTLVYCSW